MAFCNSCGTNLEAGARVCPKCGAAVPMSGAFPVAAPSVPAPQTQGNGTLKVILIVVAAIVVVGVLGIGTLIFVIRRIAEHSHVSNKDGNVRVETPFGAIQNTNDPDEAARSLGIDIYPGAHVLRGNSSIVGSMRSVEAEFETGDSPEKVLAFYGSKFSDANVSTQNKGRYTIVSTDKSNVITIEIGPEEGKTHIKIVNVSGKNVTSDSSSD